MPKKEEKKKEEEKEVEQTPESSEATKEESETKDTPNDSTDETKSISELVEENAPTKPETLSEKSDAISMDPIAATAASPTEPQTQDTETTTGNTTGPETLPIDQISEPKAVQETYPLADEIEKDGIKKKSFFSSFLIFRNKKGKIVLLILAVLLVIGLAVGTIMNANNEKLSFMKRDNKTRETVVLSPTQSPSPTPTPVAVNKESLTIEVQNGTGESGVAGKMKNFLVEKGYEGTIDTGNADNYDYTETVVKVKSTKTSIEEEIRRDLAESYTLSDEKEVLDDSSEYDVVIIVGAE